MTKEDIVTKLNYFFAGFKPFQYKRRSLILHADDAPDSVFYIKEGYVRAYRISEKGEELTLVILKPGDFFPMACGIKLVHNAYYLEALTSLEIWKVPQEQFQHFLNENPDVFNELTNNIMAKFGGILSRMEHLVFGNAYSKVVTTILICAKRFGEEKSDGVIVKVPLTHKDIAAMVGITRETACLEMKKLEKKGFVGHYGRLLLIKNVHALEEEAQVVDQEELLLNSL